MSAGVWALVETGAQNQIETLAKNPQDQGLCLTRIPGRDIEAVERNLRQNQITSVWTTISFVYPLIFESDETLGVSSAVFRLSFMAYPKGVPLRQPVPGERTAFVIENDPPLRASVEAKCERVTGAAPLVTDCGALVVIHEHFK